VSATEPELTATVPSLKVTIEKTTSSGAIESRQFGGSDHAGEESIDAPPTRAATPTLYERSARMSV
jgi:hypothetical protein